jgi:hypothetical protein
MGSMPIFVWSIQGKGSRVRSMHNKNMADAKKWKSTRVAYTNIAFFSEYNHCLLIDSNISFFPVSVTRVTSDIVTDAYANFVV